MKCPNECGEMIENEKPSLVLMDLDAYLNLPKDVRKEVVYAHLILRVCPKCGYHEDIELTQPAFEAYDLRSQ